MADDTDRLTDPGNPAETEENVSTEDPATLRKPLRSTRFLKTAAIVLYVLFGAHVACFVFQAVLICLNGSLQLPSGYFFAYPVILCSMFNAVSFISNTAYLENKEGRIMAPGGIENKTFNVFFLGSVWLSWYGFFGVMLENSKNPLDCYVTFANPPVASDNSPGSAPGSNSSDFAYNGSSVRGYSDVSDFWSKHSSDFVRVQRFEPTNWPFPYVGLWLVGKIGFLGTLTGFCVLLLFVYCWRTHQVSTKLCRIHPVDDVEDLVARVYPSYCHKAVFVSGSGSLTATSWFLVGYYFTFLALAFIVKGWSFHLIGQVLRERFSNIDVSFSPMTREAVYSTAFAFLWVPNFCGHCLGQRLKKRSRWNVTGAWLFIPFTAVHVFLAIVEFQSFVVPVSESQGNRCSIGTLFYGRDDDWLIYVYQTTTGLAAMVQAIMCSAILERFVFGPATLTAMYQVTGNDGKAKKTSIFERCLPYHKEQRPGIYVHWAKEFRDDASSIIRMSGKAAKGLLKVLP